MKKAIITFLSLLAVSGMLPVSAYAQELIVGGQAVGIRISTKGVIVAGVTSVQTDDGERTPASDAGIAVGDIITAINGSEVNGAAEFVDTVAALAGAPAELKITRAEGELCVTVQPVCSCDGQWMMGMWLRDGISGIGTVTFCDPETGIYGALGHSISDSESGLTLPLSGGVICGAEIVSVMPGEQGKPGELNGCTDSARVLGTITENTEQGIYGAMDKLPEGSVMETGEVEPGPASILCTVEGGECREFSVTVDRVYRETGGVRLQLTVTDPELCGITGGIVQGMSGSPVVQNGRLVGAVTHVFVSDPKKGYGIGIDSMLTTAGLCAEQAA